jgi:Holliday junction resolvase
MIESQIQRAIIQKLTAEGWLVIKLIKTNTNGIPDLICHRQGRTAYIEVKRPGYKPTPLQEYRHRQLQQQQIQVITATSLQCLQTLHPTT